MWGTGQEQEPDNEMWVKFYLAQPDLDFHTICLKFAPGAEEKCQYYQLYLFGFFSQLISYLSTMKAGGYFFFGGVLHRTLIAD